MTESKRRKLQFHILPLAIFTILVSGIALYVVHQEAKDFFLSVQVITGEEADKLCDKRTESSALLGDIDLALEQAIIPSAGDHSVYYLSQSLKDPEWNGSIYVAEREHPKKETADLQVYFIDDPYMQDKSAAMSEGHSFTILVCDDTSYQYTEMVMSGLPVMNITTEYAQEQEIDPEDIDEYVYNSETRYYGEIAIFNYQGNDAEYRVLTDDVVYHERGATSSIYPKSGWAIKLLEKDGTGDPTALLGMPESSKWKLVNMYTDSSRVKDRVSLKLWNSIAESAAVEESGADLEYCEVVMDGVYLGVYGLLYPIDEKTLQLDEGDTLAKVVEAIQPDLPDYSSYMYSMDNNYDVCYPIRLRFPQDYADVKPYWKQIEYFLQFGYWSQNPAATLAMFDVDNLADFYLFIQVTAASDNAIKNTYLVTRDAVNENGYSSTGELLDELRTMDAEGREVDIHAAQGSAATSIILPWDLNLTFGDVYRFDPDTDYMGYNADTSVIYATDVFRRIFEENTDGAWDVVTARYAELRSDVLSDEAICGLMEESMEQLVASGAADRDAACWNEYTYTTDLSELEAYVAARMAFLDTYFDYRDAP